MIFWTELFLRKKSLFCSQSGSRLDRSQEKYLSFPEFELNGRQNCFFTYDQIRMFWFVWKNRLWRQFVSILWPSWKVVKLSLSPLSLSLVWWICIDYWLTFVDYWSTFEFNIARSRTSTFVPIISTKHIDATLGTFCFRYLHTRCIIWAEKP